MDKGTQAKDIMLQLDIFLSLCFFSFRVSTGGPDRNLKHFLPPSLSPASNSIIRRGFLSFVAISCVSLCLISSLVRPCEFRYWTHLAGFSGPIVVVAFERIAGLCRLVV